MGAKLELPRRVLSVEDYHRMGEAGLFRPDERLELIEGDLITMAPIGGSHLYIVNLVAQAFSVQLGRAAIVSVQNPVSLRPHSEPQPDIAVLQSQWARRGAGVPSAADVLIVIEVADTTLTYDRDAKIPLYAQHGIAEAWLFDVAAEQVTVFRDPSKEGYRTVLPQLREAALAPLQLPGVTINLAEIWPPKLT
jgi:Uma2 family endonuclease